MENCSRHLSFISLYHIFLLCFLISSVKASSAVQPMENSNEDPVCALVDCGQGTCIPSNSITGFDCECNPGWKNIQIGILTFPACVVPNCTIDLQCGMGVPPPPPPPPPPPGSLLPPLPPPANLLDPCTYMWCGDGRCVTTGLTSGICKCNEGSINLLNRTSFPCFKQCNFGADCMGLGLGVFGQPPPPPQNPSGTGSIQVPNCSSRLQALTIAILAAILLM